MADPNNKMKVCDESDTDDDDDVIEELRKDYEYFPVKEEEGLFYKVVKLLDTCSVFISS